MRRALLARRGGGASRFLPLSLVLLVPPSYACPTIATGTTSPLSFDTAAVAIVRQGDRTTFSVSVNPQGDPQEFALVLPVPEVLEEDEVRTIDPGIFAALDGFTAPRHVADAGCPREAAEESDADTDADTDADADAGSVDVEAEYLVGEYQVAILSAEESVGLQAWLDDHAYFLPAGAGEVLAEYIDSGSYFLAAKVAEGAEIADGTPLSPLQVSYESPVFSIPIRLAALSSPGEQDMVIYALTDYAEGSAGISNYPEFDVPDGCIWGQPGRDDFGDFYEGLFAESWSAVGAGAWTEEFRGGIYDCNPCTGDSLGEPAARKLGFQGSLHELYATRLRMRYTPEQADEDLMLYASGRVSGEVTSYADDLSINRSCVPTFCDGSPAAAAAAAGSSEERGCGSRGSAALLVGALLLRGRARARKRP